MAGRAEPPEVGALPGIRAAIKTITLVARYAVRVTIVLTAVMVGSPAILASPRMVALDNLLAAVEVAAVREPFPAAQDLAEIAEAAGGVLAGVLGVHALAEET